MNKKDFPKKLSDVTYVEPPEYFPKKLRKKRKIGEYSESPSSDAVTMDEGFAEEVTAFAEKYKKQ